MAKPGFPLPVLAVVCVTATLSVAQINGLSREDLTRYTARSGT